VSEQDGKTPVLEFRGVDTHYGAAHILKDVDLEIYAGEMVCLLGGNASGKTTTLKTILGIVAPSKGTVHLDGEDVNGWTTADRVKAGVSMVPENRRLFKRMTVKENLEIGAYLREDEENLEGDVGETSQGVQALLPPGARHAGAQRQVEGRKGTPVDAAVRPARRGPRRPHR
jgi:branched-chain amino acid transport system ATP-binding protein